MYLLNAEWLLQVCRQVVPHCNGSWHKGAFEMVGTGWRYAVLQSMCTPGWKIAVREVVGWV